MTIGGPARRRVRVRYLVAAAAVVAALAPARAEIPARISDADFWALSERFSEPNGEFQSDNFLSNERGYQAVIPALAKTAKPGGVYLGVGPEQNFPYILALQPKMAIIFDVRRGNLHEQLLYKALFELSSDRVDFLSRLFSRPKPEGLPADASVTALMAAFQRVAPDPAMFRTTLAMVLEHLTKTHGFALHADDPAGIEYVFKVAFFDGGPNLTYSMAGRGMRNGRGGFGSTYADIQALTDNDGVNHGFLATEAKWQAMKDFESRNLVLPVVGDFAGPRAIRAVGAWLKEQGATVSAFYLSNVEQYLNRNGVEDVFLCNVAQLPLDASSTFIYTGGGRNGYGFGGGGGVRSGGLNVTFLRPMAADAAACQIK